MRSYMRAPEFTRSIFAMTATAEHAPGTVIVGPISHSGDHETPPQSLFAKHLKVYPKEIRGPWRRFKWLVLSVLLAIYYFTPWLRWDRGPGAPDQAVLVDMPGRRLYFFFIELWPQEIYFLTGTLVFCAIALFLVTTLFGRVWCGYACPQTVWTDLFQWVERKIEGDRGQRIRLDKGPWTATKVWRKTAKHSLWLLIALATGGAWIFYFNDAPTLMGQLLRFEASSGVVFFIGLFTATTYLLAGMAREQVCIYMCPWPRFQSAMQDEDSLIVTYQPWRGEPRAPLRKSVTWEDRARDAGGDCIDCGLCHHVCPTGIDIRDGQQLACISCGLCVDACNEVMARIGRPGDLIMHDTQNNQAIRARGETPKVSILRPRTIVYSLILLTVAGLMIGGLLVRPRLDVSVLRDRAPLFVTLSNGDIRNGYTVKISNMTRDDKRYTLRLAGLPQATMVLGSSRVTDSAIELSLDAAADDVTTYRLLVRTPADSLGGPATPLSFVVTSMTDGEVAVYESVFRGPE